jgi:hypothetical protein
LLLAAEPVDRVRIAATSVAGRPRPGGRDGGKEDVAIITFSKWKVVERRNLCEKWKRKIGNL